MTKTAQASTAQASTGKTWTKPELIRLGQIADVAGPSGSASQSPVQTRS